MILRAFLLVLLAAVATVAGQAYAQQYRWVDQNGKTQFSDSPPPPGAKDVRKTNSPAASSSPAPAQLPFALARLQKDFPVTLYTAPTCKEFCDQSRLALNKRGVPFKEVQVYDAESNEELKRVSGALDVPTLAVGRSVQRGFEQGAFDALLDEAGYPRTGILPARTQNAPGAPESNVPAAKPAAQPDKAAATQPKAGRYDSSGLTGPAPKPGQYDPSGLTGPAPRQGQYGIPGETK